jgi:2,3-bisphosphoglycerate-independent phosphoglycerate mutase
LSRAEYEELQPKTPSKKTGSMEGMVEMTQTKTMILDQKKKKKKKKGKKKINYMLKY